MPPKRSRSNERERKKKFRAGMSNEDKEKVNERRRNLRGNKNEKEVDFERLSSKHRIRTLRNQRTGKEKLKQNLMSKKGMRLFREEGRLKAYKDRMKQNSSETSDWKQFMQNSEKHAEMVEQSKPDIVKRINEESREAKERLRVLKERELEEEEIRKKNVEKDGGEWIYNSEYSEYYWEGEGDPITEQEPEYEPLSEKDLQNIRKQEEKRLEADKEEQKEQARERRRQKNEEQKAAMDIPIIPHPEKELCDYEKLRIKNIEERQQAMAESGFFDDLLDYKVKIGLLK